MQTRSKCCNAKWCEIDNTIARIRIGRYCPDHEHVDKELAAGKVLCLPDAAYRDAEACKDPDGPQDYAFDVNVVDTMPDGAPPEDACR
jgi:hypothetical protein